MAQVAAVTQKFVDALNEKLADERIRFEAEAGRRFDQIVTQDPREGGGVGRSSFAFVERETAYLIKSGGWKQPARYSGILAVRYHLGTDEGFADAIESADRHGGFLYVR